jgi:hypothetical protein
MTGLRKTETRQLLTSLEKQGCRIEERNGKAIVYAPDGAMKSIHWTNSDTKSVREQRAWVKRHGLEWPFDDRSAERRRKRQQS